MPLTSFHMLPLKLWSHQLLRIMLLWLLSGWVLCCGVLLLLWRLGMADRATLSGSTSSGLVCVTSLMLWTVNKRLASDDDACKQSVPNEPRVRSYDWQAS
jgi:hypothetical protein